ncbi:MAG: crosslink repair DNA glycosylase YcaQ family protein [Candidatus Nanopelagicales bacterium]
MTAHRLSVDDARRAAVRAQLLTADRPGDLLSMVRHLTLLQYEPTAAIAPSAHVVAWSRLGRQYAMADLDDALARQELIELGLMIRPREDIALYRAEMAEWPGHGDLRDWQIDTEEWLLDNAECRADILAALRADGPLPATELPDTCVRPWRSSGWTHHKNVQKMLDLLAATGEVAVAAREGGVRQWDLAERVYPDDPVVPAGEAALERARRRLASLGIVRARPGDLSTDVGEPAVVEGVRGRWVVDPAALDAPFEGRAALLSPLDRLVFDRRRVLDLFGFDYQLEMYKPAAKRRWGYWAMPVLLGDRLVGKLDATADRRRGRLVVHALHEDVRLTKAERGAIDAEIADLAAWLGLEVEL